MPRKPPETLELLFDKADLLFEAENRKAALEFARAALTNLELETSSEDGPREHFCYAIKYYMLDDDDEVISEYWLGSTYTTPERVERRLESLLEFDEDDEEGEGESYKGEIAVIGGIAIRAR